MVANIVLIRHLIELEKIQWNLIYAGRNSNVIHGKIQ